jgi:acyl-CoA synthetase (AMP-forming)/AMP-acid ligase II
MTIHPLTIGALLKKTEHRRSTGVVCRNARYTWSQLFDRISRLASGLEKSSERRREAEPRERASASA